MCPRTLPLRDSNQSKQLTWSQLCTHLHINADHWRPSCHRFPEQLAAAFRPRLSRPALLRRLLRPGDVRLVRHPARCFLCPVQWVRAQLPPRLITPCQWSSLGHNFLKTTSWSLNPFDLTHFGGGVNFRVEILGASQWPMSHWTRCWFVLVFNFRFVDRFFEV